MRDRWGRCGVVIVVIEIGVAMRAVIVYVEITVGVSEAWEADVVKIVVGGVIVVVCCFVVWAGWPGNGRRWRVGGVVVGLIVVAYLVREIVVLKLSSGAWMWFDMRTTMSKMSSQKWRCRSLRGLA